MLVRIRTGRCQACPARSPGLARWRTAGDGDVRYAWATLMIFALTTPALAQGNSDVQKRSQVLTRVVDCRKIASGDERLACYDREVAAMETAEARKDVVVVDRDQLRKTRRSLFGLSLPNLSVFGDDNDDEEGVTRIDSTIKRLSQTPYGKWVFTLEDGAQWEQIDSRDLPIPPKVGHNIKIRKAALGSYLANVKDQIAIRVKRMR